MPFTAGEARRGSWGEAHLGGGGNRTLEGRVRLRSLGWEKASMGPTGKEKCPDAKAGRLKELGGARAPEEHGGGGQIRLQRGRSGRFLKQA